jgi:dTDP-glucose 4,6-dehydratase
VNKRLLITGAAGFIGSNFVHYWLRRNPGDFVLAYDLLTYAGNIANLHSCKSNPDFLFVQGDINDTALVSSLLIEHNIDTIVHFAAESHVDRSITGPDVFIEANVNGTHSLLKAARNVWLEGDGVPHRFHHISTDEVYGALEMNEAPFHEELAYKPNSPYSASKAASDHLVRAYHHTYGLEVTTSNCSNNYGPFHFPEKLIPLCISNALRGKPLPIYGEGKNIRDWLHVEDHCRGIELILNSGRLGENYNIGGNNEWTNIDIVTTICGLIDEQFNLSPGYADRYTEAPAAQGKRSDSLITYVADRQGHDLRYAIDASKINSELGYSPTYTFESGILQTVQWYLATPQWWEPLLEK